MAAETQTLTAEQTEPTGVLGKLGVNGNLFVAQLVNFAIVLFVMWRFVYKPLLKKMDERAKKINDGLAFAKEADARLSDASAEKDRLVRDAKAEAHALMERAKTNAEAMRQEKLAQAKSEIEKVIAEAKEQIKSERASSFDALKQDIADLVTLATGKVAGGIDEKTQRNLVQGAIREIDNA